MDRSRTMPRIALISCLVLTLVGVILRTVCVLTRFDASVGYFDPGILATVSNWIYAPAVLAAAITAYFIPVKAMSRELHTPLRLPVALLLGTSLVTFTVFAFVFNYAKSSDASMHGTFLLFSPILALLASTYFFATASRSGRYSDKLAALGYIAILWCVIAIAETYTDMSVTINSPIKLGVQAGFMGFLLILLSELRFRLGKPAPRLAVAGWSLGTFLCLCGSVPVLAGFIAHILHNRLYLLYAIVLLSAGVYGGFTFIGYIRNAGADLTTSSSANDTSVDESDE